MKTAINFLSVIPMRKEPAHRSEMVSQLLFSEYAEILEEEKDFVRVKCLYDGYDGWVQANQLTVVEEILSTNTYIETWSQEVSVNGIIVRASMCSPVYMPGKIISIANREIQYLKAGENSFWNSSEKKFTKSNLEFIYQKFLNTPYLWGGRSVFGIDCSGFVQQVYKMFGVKLLRDAYLQAEQGISVGNIDETILGDLAFFHNENGRIVHVGIVLENNQIIHSSGKVRIDTIVKDGIVNNESGKRTHQLHSIRRVL
jgi:hypothetical protein